MKQARGVQGDDRRAVERWINEGGRVAAEAVIAREMAAGDDLGGTAKQAGEIGRLIEDSSVADTSVSMARSPQNPTCPRVLIAGGGVAGLETLLAPRALAADRVDVTLLAPELMFVNQSMSPQQPFRVQRRRGRRLEDTAAELGARWHHGALDRVEHEKHRVVTKDGDELPYDLLVLALGARPAREWQTDGVLTYHGGRDGSNFRWLLRQLRAGRIDKVAFVRPAGASGRCRCMTWC